MNLPIHQLTGTNEQPENIGRFEIVRVLGKGAQGIVYLAQDPQLDRQVAIKTLERHRQDHSHLLHEARNVSKLEHPNIIPIYEVGVHDDMPYLVYQFCEGNSLRNILKERTSFKPLDAAKIICHLLDAIGLAHRSGIVHRDLNPSNIMLVNDNQPRIMDFGISIMQGTISANNALAGTLNYMAPEQISNNDIGPAVDIFAIGLIFHEMLTGHQVFSADNSMAIVYKITNENILPPSKRETAVDEKLDKIIMQALEKVPGKRYGSAAEMKALLDLYLNPEGDNGEIHIDDEQNATVQFLLRRMKRKKDFPAFSTHITEINKKTANRDNSSASELSNVILKDYALTIKLLKLVNNSFYGQFGGEITTISRAVVILGYEQVRSAAMSIILFEHMNSKTQAKELKKAACTALMSGIMAREQAKKMSRLKNEDIEIAFIASMFHNLGRLLAIYYLPEEFSEIKNLINNIGMKEQQAVLSVLGVSYEDLGKVIAKDWQLPKVMSNSMQKLPKGTLSRAKTTDECIAQLANFTNELCAVGTMEGDTTHALEEISNRYNKALKLSVKDIKKLIETSKTEIKQFTRTLNINIDEVTPFTTTKSQSESEENVKITTTKSESAINNDRTNTNKISPINNNDPESEIVTSINPGQGDRNPAQENTCKTVTASESSSDAAPAQIKESAIEQAAEIIAEGSDPQNQQEILVQGIAEITNTMLENYNINDILTMILETIYRGMGFTRVLFCVRDIKRNSIIGRFGFGKNITEIIPNFKCDLNSEDDIIVHSVRDHKERIILDVNLREYKHLVPDWLRKLTTPCSIVVYPIILNKRCIGIIYADTDDTSTIISTDTLKFFKTLRNQAALAIQQVQFR